MPALVVSDLVVRYGDVVAVDGVSFEADAGQVVALLGPNGAGKTSTVETLEGYRRPSAGHVRVLGLDPTTQTTELVPRIGVMLQSGGVYPMMSSREVLELFASYYDAPAETAELLDRVGLTGGVERTAWRRLSGGEQQRLSLALALVGRPEVAFLDEPTAGIDPQGRLVIRDVIRSLREEGVCVLLTTHDLEEADKLADRVVIVDHGRVVADGPPAELRTGGGDEVRFAAPPGLDVDALGVSIGATVTEHRPGEYLVAAAGTPALVAALTAWLAERNLALGDLRAGRQSLEDVFLRLVNRSGDQNGSNDASERPKGFNRRAGRR